MSPSVDPQVANFNPTAFAIGNEQRQANLAATQQEQGLRAQDIALRQQQAQQEQVKTQLLQRQLQDQEIERQMFRDYYGAQAGVNAPSGATTTTPMGGGPSTAVPVGNPLGDPQTYARYMAAHGASAPAIMSGMSSIVTLGTNIAKLSGDQLDLETKNLNKLKDDAVGYVAQPSEQSYRDLYTDVISREPRIADELPAPGHGVAPGQQDIQHFLGKVGALGQLLANRKTQADIEEQTAKAKEEGTKAAHQELVNTLIQEGQKAAQNGQNPIRTIFPESLDKQTSDSYATAWEAAGRQPPDENGRRPAQDQIVSAAASHAAEYRKALSPTIRAVEIQKAVQENTALAPFKRQEAIDTAVGVEKAKAALSPDVFNSIIDPTARNRALNDWTKANATYQDEAASADKLLQYVAAARSGNQTAAAQIPIAELRSIVSRVTNQELEATGEGLSIGRKISNLGDKAFTGKPTEATLGEYEQLANIMKDTATRSYAGRMLPLQQQGAKVSLAPPQIPASVAGQRINAPAAPSGQYVRTAVGPKGHRIGQTADGKWHDTQTGAVLQ